MIVAYVIAVRTSIEASSTIRNVDRVLPLARACRRRLTMFSTSMIASSTTTPIATTRPARTMTLIVASRRSSTSTAARSESGIATRLMNAVRNSKRNAAMMRMTSSTPMSRARLRLSIDCSMNVAGRKICESISMPGRPALSWVSASSTPSVTSTVFAPRYFWTMSRRPGPPLTTPSPQICWLSWTTRPRSAIRRIRPPRVATGTCARSAGSSIGWMFSMFSRRLPYSTKPPWPTVKLLAYCSTPASSASEPACMTSSIAMPCLASVAGSTCTWRCLRRSP